MNHCFYLPNLPPQMVGLPFHVQTTLNLKTTMQDGNRIPISQNEKLRLQVFEASFTFTQDMAKPGWKQFLLNSNIQTVLIKYRMAF